MIHLEPLPAVQLHREHLERLLLAQRKKDSIKVIRSHVITTLKHLSPTAYHTRAAIPTRRSP
jgi:hypothetical protein